ncbi:MFS transporter [Sphingobium subterraneum]|uniref:Multidrug efflux pump Tap n=1 Tax=Sphingobium subterraneum TaxID=627688 RepID=A0A841J500_9SPHN|nr:MFS transporter [Sphingobium subterraneum]MBB6123645.1 MFS family permease [Sphingobium subterraneum]
MTASSLAAAPAHPLSFRDFRLFLLTRLATVLAQNAMIIVIGWQAYNIARQTMDTHAAAAQLGLIGLVQFVPIFLLTPLTGYVADRFDRRMVAALALLAQAVCVVLLAMLTYRNALSLPVLFSMAASVAVARSFTGPSLGSLSPNLVPPATLPRAIAFSSIMWQVGTIAGPAVGGYLYGYRPWAAYAVAAAMFFVAFVAIAAVRPLPRKAPSDRSRSPIRQIIDGLAYVRSNRLVLAAITLDLVAVMLAGVTAVLPIYVRDIFHSGASSLGHLAAAPGLGAAVVAVLFSFRPPRTNVGNKMLGAVVVFGLSIILFGLTAFMPSGIGYPVALLALMLSGVSDMVSVFIRQSLIQLSTPDEMRGRVSSVSLLTIAASNELGEAESGFLAALIGPTTAVLLGGAGAIVVTVLWARIFPELGLARSFDPHDIAQRDSDKEATT